MQDDANAVACNCLARQTQSMGLVRANTPIRNFQGNAYRL